MRKILSEQNSLSSEKPSIIKEKNLSSWESFKSGDKNGLDEVFKAHYSALFNYGCKFFTDEELVRDGIQELFLNLWRMREQIVVPNSERAYLLSSLKRTLVAKVKSNSKRTNRNNEFQYLTFKHSFSMEEFLIEEERKKEKLKQLVDAVNALSTAQREVIYLRYYQGLTNDEIAELLDINLQSVKNRVSRALHNMRINVGSLSFTALYLLSSFAE